MTTPLTTPPLYTALAVADIESFGRRTDTVQRTLRSDLHAALAAALSEEGIDWSALESKETGDGVILRIPPVIPKTAITRALTWHLHAALVRRTLSEPPAEEMRLRLSLHGGEVADDEFGVYGTDLNTACRLVDAQVLRDVLKAATRSHLAVIASDAWYRAVVRHDHERIDRTAYAPALLVMKELRETAWIHVPGQRTPPGLPPYDPAAESGAPVAAAKAAPTPDARSITITNSNIHDVVQGDKHETNYHGAKGAER
ncbi:MAG TPA: hypothetical protein VGS97_15765 [Actinocrinis sp.]|uniref:hypothetical protein n=1 Tax=Actinocrinis sp. TaxID=1920516 RepID=UPI002DDCCBDC|nr:hypothetical protein [Actinocrinis sp.]HEV2345555.1 hypothetical protein [Actinocrinis sp.]